MKREMNVISLQLHVLETWNADSWSINSDSVTLQLAINLMLIFMYLTSSKRSSVLRKRV